MSDHKRWQETEKEKRTGSLKEAKEKIQDELKPGNGRIGVRTYSDRQSQPIWSNYQAFWTGTGDQFWGLVLGVWDW